MKKIYLTILILLCLAGQTIKAQVPQLWGLTKNCGANNAGSIIKINEDGTGFQTMYSFDTLSGINPDGNLLMATDGKLYGLLCYGGSDTVHHSSHLSPSGSGVIFSFDPVYHIFTVLYNFDFIHGFYPHGSLIQLSNGRLYGTASSGGVDTNGVIFSYDPMSHVYTDLYEFHNISFGTNPCGSLVKASNGKLYGATHSGGNTSFIGSGAGILFCFDPVTNTFSLLHNFDLLTGWNPLGNLIQATDGKLYGSTINGGDTIGNSLGKGVLYSFDPSTNIYSDLYNDTMNLGFSALIQATNGKLYGSALGGKIFSFDISTNIFSIIHSTFPFLNNYLVQGSNGKLFGAGQTSIFSIDTLGNNVSTLYSFNCIVNGAFIELPFNTGVSETIKQDNKVLVYPNPASTTLTIRSQLRIANEELRIMDVLGNLVFSQPLNQSTNPTESTNTTINISKLSNGIYFYEVRSGLQIPTSMRGKFIIQH